MTYVFIAGAVLLAAIAAWQALRARVDQRAMKKLLRWGAGGGAALIALLLLFARRIDIASVFGVAAYAILMRGRLGPFSFESDELGEDNVSRVRSRYFAMELDHASGNVQGRVLSGQFAGADLIDLGEMETRALITEVERDPDSLSLLESWLDANRTGWREYFEETARAHSEAPAGDPVAQAYEVLGLEPGATDEEIRAAHRELMKGVHPDHGGSAYLASRINEARDLLLRKKTRR